MVWAFSWTHQAGEKLVQQVELLGCATRARASGGECVVECLPGRIELGQDQERLAVLFLKGHRGNGTILAFLIRPDDAGVGRHFDIPADERHGLLEVRVAEHEAVRATRANISLAGHERNSERGRRPPPLEQLGPGPGLEHDVRGAVEGARDDYLTLGRSFDCRGVLHGVGLPFSFGALTLFCRFKSSTTLSNSSKRASQRWRYLSIHATSSSSRPRPSLHVRTRPTFSVVTSPARSRTPTCFFMPVRVIRNFAASSVIDASAWPSRSRMPRRVASESAANEASRRARRT